MAKKKQHGGKRPNSGRPVGAEGKSEIMAVSVPSELLERFDAYRDKLGLSRSKAAQDAIRGMLDAKR